MKSLLDSKTFWFAVAKFILGGFALFTADFGMWIPAGVAGGILMLTSVMDVVLRLNTSQAISGITPQ